MEESQWMGRQARITRATPRDVAVAMSCEQYAPRRGRSLVGSNETV